MTSFVTLCLNCFRFLFSKGTTIANPYTSPLTYSSFTPWLGESVRVEDVPKTEALKGFSQRDQLPTSSSITAFDEDTILRLLDSYPVRGFNIISDFLRCHTLPGLPVCHALL